KGDPKTQIGVMAQDVEKDNPDAVSEFGGIKMVDYNQATKTKKAYANGGLVNLFKGVLAEEEDEDEKKRGLDALLNGEGNSTDWLLGALEAIPTLMGGQSMFANGGVIPSDKDKNTITWDDGTTSQLGDKSNPFSTLFD